MLVFAGTVHAKKPTRGASSTSAVGVVGRRGKRKRPPVEEDDEDDDGFIEGGEDVMVEGRESYINGLLKQLIKVPRSRLHTL